MVVLRGGLFVSLLVLLSTFSKYEPAEIAPEKSRYKKISMQGKEVALWQGPWACVLDTVTGLLWENKTDDEGIHDANWSYSWYIEGRGVADSGDCYFEASRCDTHDLIRHMNEQETCARSNWRLPSSQELGSLISKQAIVGDAKIAKDFFSFTKRSVYWTSDHSQLLEPSMRHYGFGASVVDFKSGEIQVKPYSTAPFLRLVSGPI